MTTLPLRQALLCALFLLFTVSGFSAGHTVSFTNVINITCNGGCNGSVTGVVTGGTGPFQYNWTPSGGTSANAGGLCAGAYTLTVTDMSDNSTASNAVTIGQPTAITLTQLSVTPATCNLSNGSIAVSVTGGNGPYTYMWVPLGGSTPTITNRPGGTYTFTVTDANGCITSQTFTIPNQPGPTLTMPSPATICSGASVTLSPTVSGGNSPYTYSWTPAFSLSSNNMLSVIAAPVTTTTYTLIVTDATGCSSSGSVTVTVNPSFTSTVSITPATCNLPNGAAVASIVSGGTAPFTYTWSNSSSGSVISNVSAGSYTVNITDSQGCISQEIANIPSNGGPSVTAVTAQNCTCANNPVGMVIAQASGNAPPFTYNWLTNPAIINDTAAALFPGTYTVQVTDNAGCVSFGQTTVSQLTGNFYLYASVVAPANCNTATGQANSIVQGGTAPYTWLWSDNSTSQNLVNVAGGYYSVTVTDANGCARGGGVFIGTTCFSVVRGRYYNDFNNNCIFDTGDIPAANNWLQMQPSGNLALTDSAGNYVIHAPVSGSQTITPVGTLNSYYTATCPSVGYQAITIPMLGDTVSGVDFARVPAAPIQDLHASLTTGPARPGFIQNFYITYTNVGTIAMTDTLFFWHDPILTYSQSYPVMDNYTGNRAYWLFNNLLPGEQHTIALTMWVPTIQNGGYLGRQLVNSVLIQPTVSDTTPIDNGDDEVDVIVGSWDPNKKEVWAPGINANGDITPADSLLSYTIGFQNTGTDTAFTVVVKDTLPAQLDVLTLQPGASSHPYVLTMETIAGGLQELSFTFYNILLPDSFVNEPASHGWVKFRIKRMPGLPVGTVITNTASNYFDFNPPVATNTLNTMIVQPLGAISCLPVNGISVAPNPFNETTTILFDKTQEFELELYDLSGRRVLKSGKQNGNSYVLKRSSLESGVYLCRVTSPGQPERTMKIVVR